MKPLLSNEQLNIFSKEGYVTLPGFFNQEAVDQMLQWTEEIHHWPVAPNEHLNYYEMVNGKKTLSRTEGFLPYHVNFDTFIKNSGIFSMIEQLLNEPAFLFKEKINYKYPGTGRYPAHQDIHAAKKSPLAFQAYHRNCLIFMDDSTEENGCLYVAPGYENQFLDINVDGSLKEEIVKKIQFRPLTALAGTICLFNMYVPHWSALNTSTSPRRTIFLTFNGKSKRDLRAAHFEDRAKNLAQTREINSDLFVDDFPKESVSDLPN
jgi:hypothetical protein